MIVVGDRTFCFASYAGTGGLNGTYVTEFTRVVVSLPLLTTLGNLICFAFHSAMRLYSLFISTFDVGIERLGWCVSI